MSEVRYVPAAIEDLDAIWLFISTESGSYEVGDRIVRSIVDKCTWYADQPLLGELRNDLLEDVRCFSVHSFVVFYLPTQTGLNVLQVIHGARDITTHFRR